MENNNLRIRDSFPRVIEFSAFILLGGYILLNGIRVVFKYYFPEKQIPVLIQSSLEILNTPFIIAFFTAMYVLFTYLMFTKMKEQAELTRNQIENSLRPNVAVNIIPFGCGGVMLELKNIGRGNAYDVFIEYEIKIKEKIIEKDNCLIQSLMPKESSRIILFSNMSYVGFLKKFDSFEFNLRYYSDTGNAYKIPLKRIFNLKKMLEYGSLGKRIIEKDLKEEVHEVVKEIKEIKKEIKKWSKKK